MRKTSIYKKKFTLKTFLLCWAGLAVIGLVVYNTKDALFGAPLSLTSTTDGATLSSAFLPISGVAKHAREVLINGRSIAFDRKGSFTDGVLLSPGYNIVEVTLKDQFGNKKVKSYHVVVETPPAVAQASDSPYQ